MALTTFSEMKGCLTNAGIATDPHSSIGWDIQQWVRAQKWGSRKPDEILQEVNNRLQELTGSNQFIIRKIYPGSRFIDCLVSINGFDFNVDIT